MKIILVLCSLVFVSHCMKENIDNLDDVLRNPNLWSLIQKRFGLSDGDESRHEEPPPRINQDRIDPSERDDFASTNPQNKDRGEDSERNGPKDNLNAMEDSLGNLCKYHGNSSLIIRSKASLAAGAFFLKTISGIGQKACVDDCCYTQGCNMAIYENKDEHNCYLFNCGTPNKCLFAVHANYTTMMFPNHVPPAGSVSEHQSKHEDELEGLGVKTTTKATTTTPVPTTRKPVALYGSCDIDWGDRCADPNAECRDEQCKCGKGYHAKYGICRKICEEPKFECENKGQSGSVPECIDEEHVCDGTPQCADGSDEEGCKPDLDETPTWKHILDQYMKGKEKTFKTENENPYGRFKGKDDNSDTEPWLGHKKKVWGPTMSTPAPAPERPVIHHVDESPKLPTHKPQISPNRTDWKSGTEKPKVENTHKPTMKTTTVHRPSTTPVPTKTNITAEKTKTHKGNNSSLTSSHSKKPLAAEDEGFEKVKIVSPTDSNQGPIVALALGLGITLMLLVFVGCRLRTVKRRIRKGRALHSNEADYLINGMYL